LQVLHVLEPPDGGVPRYVRDVVAGLTQRGHTVGAAVTSGSRAARLITEAGAGVFPVGFAREMVAPLHDVRAIGALRRVLRDRRWDLVHTHGSKAGELARPLARLRGIPVAHSPHGFAYAAQHLRDRRAQRARRALTLSIERALAHTTTTFIFVSETERDDAVRDGIASPERAAIVRPGVASEPAEPAAASVPGLDGDDPLIGFVGRLSPEKDPLLFVAALEALRSDGVGFRAVVVGDGPLDRQVRARIADAGLQDRVLAAPFDELGHSVLHELDVYVLPSRYEVLPIGALEAMAAGVPVVARDVGAVAEAVRDGETGLLVREHTPDAVASALKRLVADPALRVRLGSRGRQLQRELFGLDRMIDDTEAAYRRVVTSSA
jgi:glycosyltransferase involved in cell wall biosynthesis